MRIDLERRALELFEQVVDLKAGPRSAVLNEKCGDNAELRAAVESLLETTDDDGVLWEPLLEPEATEPVVELVARMLGQRLGNYRIESLIAAGGAGIVFKAMQQKPSRPVALKLMNRQTATQSTFRRFQLEAQILARLRDDRIAKIYEAASYDDGLGGMPYFTMEYVPGARTIVEYAERKKLSTRQRLELMVQVCEAIHHGHQQAIIHRDLKPGNILVDHEGKPKIIDFGVARATDSDMALTSGKTQLGDLVGTPQYMSPEQFDGDPHALTISSDIYSLGVVMYELVTGTLPYDASSVYHAAEIIRTTTPRPPRDVNPKLRGDVETIILKALQKEPERRFQSALETAQEMQRYLDHEPILTRRDNLYRLRKLLWKHRVAFGALAGVFMILVAATAVAVAFWRTAEQSRGREAAARVQAVLAQALAATKLGDPAVARTALETIPPQERDWTWRHIGYLTDQSLIRLESNAEPRSAIACSPDGRLVATAGHDRVVRIWETAVLESTTPANPTPLHQWRLDEPLLSLAFSPAGDMLAAGNVQAGVHLLRLGSAEPQWSNVVAPVVRHNEITGIAFHPTQPVVAATPLRNPAGTVVFLDAETGKTRHVFHAHDDTIEDFAFSRDGTRLVTASHDGTVKVWDARDADNPRWLATLRGHGDKIMGLAFRPPDDGILATVSLDGTVRFWDVPAGGTQAAAGNASADGVEILTVTVHDTWLLDADWNPDGTLLAVAGGDRLVHLWRFEDDHRVRDPVTGVPLSSTLRCTRVASLRGHERQVDAVRFVKDGAWVVSGSRDGTSRAWHAGTRSPLPVLDGHGSSVYAVGFSHDGRWVASSSGDNTVIVWDAHRFVQLHRLPVDGGDIRRVVWHPDRMIIAACTDNGSVVLWTRRDGSWSLQDVAGPGGTVRALAFDPEGDVLAWAGDRRDLSKTDLTVIHRRNLTTDRDLPDLIGFQDCVTALEFSRDGQLLAAASEGHEVRVWDVHGNAKLWDNAREHEEAIWDVALDRTGILLFTASGDGTIGVWEARNGTFLDRLTGHTAGVLDLAIHPNEDRIASGSRDFTVKIWNTISRELVATLDDPPSVVFGVAWSADGQRLATAEGGFEGKGNSVRIWESEADPAWQIIRAEKALFRERAAPYIERLLSEHVFEDKALDAAESDSWLDAQTTDADSLRRTVCRLLPEYAEKTSWKVRACWKTVCFEGADAQDYERALSIAEHFVEKEKKPAIYFALHGMALYRVGGRDEEALQQMVAAQREGGDTPAVLGFTAMIHQRLGHADKAERNLQSARALMAENAEYGDHAEYGQLLAEAESMIDPQGVMGHEK